MTCEGTDKMGILQAVFELTNVEGVKVLTILGMKFKLKKKNKDDKKYILEPIYCNFVNRFCKVKKNKIVFINLLNMKTENTNAKPLPQFEEETKEGMSFFSRDIVVINQDMVFSHLPEWKREQILEILLDYVD